MLNLGLYGVGVMRKAVYQGPVFKYKLNKCSNLNNVHKLLAENANYTNLLKSHAIQPLNC